VALPININDLLGARTVESNRIEFKEGWNPDAIYRSICAFANDFDNSGGGYIVIGVAEEQGRAKRPVKGLTTDEIARIQREMIGYNNLIKPAYHPRLSIEEVDGQQILVLWVLGSSNRPHEAPEQVTAKQKVFHYYVRQYANSVRANPGQQQELIAMTNQVPFDDRPNTQATLSDISLLWISEYLRVAKSRLAEQSETLNKADLLEQMSLLVGPPEYRFPRNVALMLFCNTPETFFPYTYIELVHFRRNPGDREFNETRFTGPVQEQIRQFIDYLKSNILTEKVIKHPDRAEATRLFNYPLAALEEAIANCIYHRDYTVREPVKVFIEADHIRMQNLGGPDRAIRAEDFQTGRVRPKRYRNRRLGDFMKALDLTEGHATGIKLILDEMAANGSPTPRFDFDEERSYFEVELPIHPAFAEKQAVAATTGIGKTTQLQQILDELEPNSLAILKAMPARPIRRSEVLALAQLSNETRNASRYLDPLLKFGLLAPTISDRPRSPLQQYVLTQNGQEIQHTLSVL